MNFLLITSSLMMFLKHPLSLGFTILMHTILTCMVMGWMSTNYWFSYILILIMIGGLLVLFIYMTSIASNEKFKFNKILMIFMFTMMILTILLNYKMPLFKEIFYLNNELMNNMLETKNFKLNMSKFLNFPNSNLFIIIIFYLLIAMIAVVKITKLNYGPLRQLKYENTFTKK
uniref:NADH dehydrogenase subunit 6 n=1 Tax=Illeis bistigmosa TaxID=2840401 RepID=UPI001FAEF0A9|nr:NADH dehydrogenase subunit 6 [Illeis bistigmosa]UJP68267.1 NADH dehydrogenase subunit 6 [Illeis bistigmosa]